LDTALTMPKEIETFLLLVKLGSLNNNYSMIL